MSLQLTEDVSAAALARYDMVIDVRSPGEFAEDHLPHAVNLPVLDDAERAMIGTIYVQESRFKARRVGAALVARNVARHLETALADKAGGFAPLLYCWRGGMRSNAMATILSQIGWRTTVLTGGYRTWRRQVTARLYDSVGGATDPLRGPTQPRERRMVPRGWWRGVEAAGGRRLEACVTGAGVVPLRGPLGDAEPLRAPVAREALGLLS